MKKIFVILLVMVVSLGGMSVQGQNLIKSRVQNLPNYDYSPLHFGFLLGINQMNFSIDPLDELHLQNFVTAQADDILPAPDSLRVLGIDQNPQLGFTVGIVGNLRLGEYTDLRLIPSLSFGERVLKYSIQNFDEGTIRDTITMEKRISSTYIDIPLLIKYKSKRYNNMRAYLIGGAKYSLDLASLSDKKRDEDANSVLMKLDKSNASMVLGFGFDFYFAFFKLGTEITMSYSLNDPLEYEDNLYTGSIEEMKSKVFQISFTIE